jgi:ADP-ribose pyrophosphatase YjhB (NUDIX family)
MENGETTEQAAMRETWEEACARIEIISLYSIFSIPHISQVYMLYRGRLVGGDYRPGCESLECRLFDAESLPWDRLAFAVVEETLKRYFDDQRKQAGFPLHRGDILKQLQRG